MNDDIPKNVIEETDEVAERIFNEWDKWLEGSDDPRKIALRDWQNEIRDIEDKIAKEGLAEEEVLALQENRIVLTKKMKKQIIELLAEMKPELEEKPKQKKNKRRRR